MKTKKYFFLLAWMVGSSVTIVAQDTVETTLQADVVNHYVWRGMELGHASVQPSLGFAWKGLSLSAFGSMGITTSNDIKEIDLTASYMLGGFSAGITDYWSNDPDIRYFYYKSPGTSHVFEGFVGYDFGVLRASWQTIFAGNDYLASNGNRAYSSYFELTAPFTLATCEWEATLGAVPYTSDFYDTSGFALTNVSLKACKEIAITDRFTLPIFAQLVANPRTERAYFIFGITLQPFK